MTQIKRARRNQVNTLEKRPDRSERELQLYLGASVSFELPLSSASLPPSTTPSSLGLSTIVKLLPLCTTKIYCTACISSYAVQCSTASAPMVGYPRSRELIEAENPLHPCTLHPLASTCSSAALLAPLAIPPSPLFQSSLSNTFETLLGCLPPTDLAAH